MNLIVIRKRKKRKNEEGDLWDDARSVNNKLLAELVLKNHKSTKFLIEDSEILISHYLLCAGTKQVYK